MSGENAQGVSMTTISLSAMLLKLMHSCNL